MEYSNQIGIFQKIISMVFLPLVMITILISSMDIWGEVVCGIMVLYLLIHLIKCHKKIEMVHYERIGLTLVRNIAQGRYYVADDKLFYRLLIKSKGEERLVSVDHTTGEICTNPDMEYYFVLEVDIKVNNTFDKIQRKLGIPSIGID